MREIRYKAWDVENKKMFFPNWLLTIGGTDVDKMEHPELGEMHRSNKTAILIQYSGLKDKNGKKIYEGDIMKFPRDGPEHSMVVTFKYGMFFLVNNSLQHYIHDVVVVGNIYENPELVKRRLNE